MALTVAQLTARLTADTSNFYKGMAVADAALFRTGSIARRIGVGAGLAVAGIGVMSLKMAGNFEQSMDVLGAVSGATTGELKKMQDQAIALGRDLKLPNVSAKDASDAMTELAKAGLSVKDVIGASRGVLQLGVAGNIKFGESAIIVARALNAFKMKGSEATKVADLLTSTANKTTADINDMALGVQMASSQFRAAGFDLDDLTTSLGLMANAGIAGSDAGTSLKTMMNRLTAPTSTASKKMKELGISVYDSSGEVKKMPTLIQHFNDRLRGLSNESRNAALYTMFGSDAIRAARVQLNAGAQAWNELNVATTAGGDAQAFAEARTKGFNGAIQGVISQVETLAIELGMALLPAATAAARGLSDFLGKIDVGKITAFFGFLADGVRVLYAIATANGAATPMILGMVAAFATLKFIIYPLIAGITALRTAVMALSTSLALNPVTAWAVAIGAVVGLVWGFASAASSAAGSSRSLASAVSANAAAFDKFRDSMSQVTASDIRYKQALMDRAVAQREVKNLEAAGATSGMAYAQASLRLERANLEVRDSAVARTRAVKDSDKSTRDSVLTDNNLISSAKRLRDEKVRLARQMPANVQAARDADNAQKDLNKAYDTAIKNGGAYTQEVERVASTMNGPAKKAFLDANKWVAGWKVEKAKEKLADTIKFISGQAPTAAQQSQVVGTGIATGIAAGITSAPAVQAAVRTVQEAIAAAKAVAQIKSPSELAAKELGQPLSAGIAAGINVAAPQVNTALMNSILKPIPLLGAYAKGAAANIAKKYTDQQLYSFVTGSAQLPEKMGASLKRMINKQKSILDAAKPMFDRWFSRLQDRAMRAFDAVTAAAKMPSEIALGGKTVSEQALSDEQGARDSAALQKQEDDANAIINGAAARRAAIIQKEDESIAEFHQRQAEEIKQIDQDVATAKEATANAAWERRRAILETNAANERAILETAAAQERLDWESRRENERIALEDRITKLQENLLKGKTTMKKANAEINAIMKDAGVDMAHSGKILGREFAAGLAATRGQVLRQARMIAAAVKRILQLNSPAKEGPLSNLDTWWDAFVPTLTQGLDTRGLSSVVSSAVGPPSLRGIGSGGTPGATINLTVTDSTLSGMSREQADRVARDIKAALDRQVNASF